MRELVGANEKIASPLAYDKRNTFSFSMIFYSVSKERDLVQED